MSENTEKKIAEMVDSSLTIMKKMHEKMTGGHFEDKPSSGTKIELAGIKKDVENINNSVGRLEKAVEKFTESADDKYADKKLTEEKFKNVDKALSFHTKIMYSIGSLVFLAVVGAIINLVIVK